MRLQRPIRIVAVGLGVLLIASLAGRVYVQQNTIAELRATVRMLQENGSAVRPAALDAGVAERLRNLETENNQLRENSRDLFRLRNEARQFRQQQEQTDLLRTANDRLLQLLQSMPLSSTQMAVVAAVRQKGALLGVVLRPPNDPGDLQGAVVMAIDPNSPVSGTDLKAGDVIVRLDGRPISSATQLQVEMMSRRPGETVTLDVLRGGTPVRITTETRGWQ